MIETNDRVALLLSKNSTKDVYEEKENIGKKIECLSKNFLGGIIYKYKMIKNRIIMNFCLFAIVFSVRGIPVDGDLTDQVLPPISGMREGSVHVPASVLKHQNSSKGNFQEKRLSLL